VAHAAGILGLGQLLERRPAALSGGQRQRVAMGRAMVREPRVFLLDEPLSNLDAKLRVQVRGEIAALQRRLGTTMLYVTHDQAEAMTLGQRVAVLESGELRQVGAPQALYDRPANRFVAGFLGSPPMNLFVMPLARDGDGLVLEFGATRLAVADAHREALRSRAGQVVHVGLRPEAIRCVDDASPAPGRVAVEVAGEERLGHERILHAVSPCECIDATGAAITPAQFALRLPPGQPLRVGERVSVEMQMDRAHYFDPDGTAIVPA